MEEIVKLCIKAKDRDEENENVNICFVCANI